MKLTSIQTRILLGVGVLQLGVAVLAFFVVLGHSRKESLAALDANLASRATTLLALIQAPEDDNGNLVLRRELLYLPRDDRFELSDAQGSVIAETPGWRVPGPLPSGKRANFTVNSGGVSYRILLIHDASIVDSEEGEHVSPRSVVLLYGTATTETHFALRRLGTFAALCCAAMLAISLVATFWIVRIGLRPLQSLAAEASRIDARSCEFEVPASSLEVFELKPLSFALSDSLRRLKGAFQRERQMFGDAAHELKTAVAIVKSTLQLALQADRPAEDYRRGLVRTLEDTERLEQLVLRMLQLAAIENQSPTEHVRTDADSAIEAAMDQFATLAQARGVRMRVAKGETHSIKISEQDYSLLVGNLIQNAIQHSPPGGEIEVMTRNDNGTSELIVEDHGPGIPMDALPHLFERFYRVDEARSRTNGGFGLGLAIVHAVAGKYGGTVAVQSRPGEGAKFIVHLPSAADVYSDVSR